MFQVYITVSGSGQVIEFGPPTESLQGARTIVKVMDWLFDHLELAHGQHIDNPAVPEALRFYEGSDVYCKSGDKLWVYMDQDPSGASDGIWFVA